MQTCVSAKQQILRFLQTVQTEGQIKLDNHVMCSALDLVAMLSPDMHLADHDVLFMPKGSDSEFMEHRSMLHECSGTSCIYTYLV